MIRHIFITGANRGIGLALVKHYLEQGDRVSAACREPDKATKLEELKHGRLSILKLDLYNKDDISALKEVDGPIDICINNAGVYGPSETHLDPIDPQAWLDVMQINVIAPYHITLAIMPQILAGRHKKIIFITSKMGSISDNSSGGSYVYRSSKAALNQMVRSLSVDLQSQATANVIHPGWVKTDMGGPNGLISAEKSASSIANTIENLGNNHTGCFYNYDGKSIAW
jgi:NAD(P)-dependent dehydrogenase (short-subunit alcohol dehydrogenase family)